MPFGLTNAPSTFQDMMNHVLSDLLDVGVLAYMDDILVYASTKSGHDRLVKEVLRRLQDKGLAVCESLPDRRSSESLHTSSERERERDLAR